jgi:CrcB protein
VSWWEWVLIGVAGAVGAPLRYLVDTVVSDRVARTGAFPYGTMVVNVSGSLLLGVITGLFMYHGLGKPAKVVLGTGFLGAYTTFSTFGYETIALLEEGEGRSALINVAGSLVAGALAGAAGIALGSL